MRTGSHQITQRDVTVWGVAALACGALAVLAGNLGGLVPAGAMAALHGTRLGAASLQEVRGVLEDTRQETADLAAANRVLTERFDLIDYSATEMMRRVAAVEQSVPLLIEALPPESDIDRSLLTAAIGSDPGEVQEVEGGLMALSQRQMLGDAPADQPLPPLADAEPAPLTEPAAADPLAAFAIDLGQVAIAAADARWDELVTEVGPLLLGLEPRIMLSAGQSRLVAGPFASESAAATVCERLDRVGTDCSVASFGGSALELAAPAGENG